MLSSSNYVVEFFNALLDGVRQGTACVLEWRSISNMTAVVFGPPEFPHGRKPSWPR